MIKEIRLGEPNNFITLVFFRSFFQLIQVVQDILGTVGMQNNRFLLVHVYKSNFFHIFKGGIYNNGSVQISFLVQGKVFVIVKSKGHNGIRGHRGQSGRLGS